MSKLYAVIGETGEYDCHRDWIVGVTRDYEKAVAHRQACADWYNDFLNGKSAYEVYFHMDYDERKAVMRLNKFDPDMDFDSTGTTYDVIEMRSLDDED